MLKEEDYSLLPDIFNLKNYIPKTPTQQLEFLKKFPNFDGRGVKIGIIDSGIDVSLPGLQQTSEGYQKIIDCLDLTGNGHVNTSTVRKIDKNILIGLTSRQLKIPKTWKNPSGKWHLGIKSIYELFDDEALLKITELRKKQIKEQNEMLKSYIDEISDEKDRNFMLKYLDATEVLSKDSLVADCIVWNDGIQWQACIDTSFIGDLSNVKVLTNYRDCHEFGMFFDVLTFCLNIRENGNLLEIYVPYDSHGTMVANIAAGYYPEEPEKNGLAPGAQIISFGVSDPRNYSISLKKTLVQAFLKCIDFKVDIINISVTTFPNDEYEMVKEMAEKHGIIIFKAAGNDGPIYSSVYEIEQFQNLLFNIGSCLTAEMKKILFKLDTDNPPTISSFSSQGPMPKSGGCGITAVAPGHGVTDVPRHYPYKTRLFGATSFASPNAVGAIACLISGLKANSIPLTFFKLKLALINTAFLPDGGSKLAFGSGIIQIKNAFEFYLKNLQNFPVQITNISTLLIPRFKMFKFLYGSNYKNGILLKVVDKNLLIYKYSVKIEVNKMPLDGDLGDSKMIDWHLKLSQNAENFITYNSSVNQNNEFFIEINIATLNENSVNYAEILGYISSNLPWGPLFHLPITVIIPKNFNEREKIIEIIQLNSTFPYRLFIPPFLTEISEFFIRLTLLENEITDVITIKLQSHSGNEEIRLEDLKELEFTERNRQKSCSFENFNQNEIHEICIIVVDDDEKVVDNLKFQFEISLIEETSIFTKIWSSFFEQSEEQDDENSSIESKEEDDFENCSSESSTTDNSDIITYKLFSQKVKHKTINKNEFFIVTYYLTVLEEEAFCLFDVIYPDEKFFKPYRIHRIQIFTLSKKFVASYSTTYTDYLSLRPGTYVIKALFEYCDDKILQIFLPFTFKLPLITVSTYSDATLKTLWSDTFNVLKKYENSVKVQIGNYLPSISNTNKIFNDMNEHDAHLWVNIIQKYYCSCDIQNVKKVADLFLQKVKAKQFLKNYDKKKNDENFVQKELIKTQNELILDALFYKADTILNEYLKSCENVPEIFKANFGFQLINYNFESKMQKLHPSIFDILWSIFTYNIYPNRKQHAIKNRPKLPYLDVELRNKNSPKNYHKRIDRKNVKKITSLFLQSADDSDIRKSIITIKKALILGNIGTALFYLNKISTENQTLPNFKIFDEAIVQLLKQLGWKHLVEAHENALLDRNRNYYRMF